jgi:hypothetical protein
MAKRSQHYTVVEADRDSAQQLPGVGWSHYYAMPQESGPVRVEATIDCQVRNGTCVAVHIEPGTEGERLTAESIRALPLGDVIHLAEWATEVRPARLARPRGPKERPPEHYEAIAQLYRDLVESGERHPVRRMALIENYSTVTIRRWLAECRKPERGLLGPRIPGKAGEAKRPRKTTEKEDT